MNLKFFTYFMFQFFQCWQEFFEGGVHNTMVCSLWLVFMMFFLIIVMVQIDFLALKVKLAHKTNSYSYQLTVGLPCFTLCTALLDFFFICTHIKVSDFFVLPLLLCLSLAAFRLANCDIQHDAVAIFGWRILRIRKLEEGKKKNLAWLVSGKRVSFHSL